MRASVASDDARLTSLLWKLQRDREIEPVEGGAVLARPELAPAWPALKDAVLRLFDTEAGLVPYITLATKARVQRIPERNLQVVLVTLLHDGRLEIAPPLVRPAPFEAFAFRLASPPAPA